MPTLSRLAALIRQDRDTILTRWRRLVRELPSAAHLDTPTLNDHIPTMLEEMAAALRANSKETIAEALSEASGGSPPAHGVQRVADGFDIEEVVAEYNILRTCIHEVAEAAGLNMQGEPVRIVNTVIDTAIALAVKTFAECQAREVQRRREEYLSFVAHDMRTPLAAVSLAAHMLGRLPNAGGAGGDADGRRAHLLGTLTRNVAVMGELVKKVLDENTHTEGEAGMKPAQRHIELWPLVESLVQGLHDVAGSSQTRVVNQVPDDLTVYADAALLQRIFQNLVANAIRYTPRGEVCIGARKGDGGVECWVSDNGQGMPESLVHRVFDKGETDPESKAEGGEGLGLGLSIVKTFVEAHGGSITVASTLGKGTQFRFNLPERAAGGTSKVP